MTKTYTYQGKTVSVVRNAVTTDTGYDKTKDQIIINDGTSEKTVLRSEVTEIDKD